MFKKALKGEPAHTAMKSYIFLGQTGEMTLNNIAMARPTILLNTASTGLKIFFSVSHAIIGASFYNQKPLLPKFSHTHFYYV